MPLPAAENELEGFDVGEILRPTSESLQADEVTTYRTLAAFKASKSGSNSDTLTTIQVPGREPRDPDSAGTTESPVAGASHDATGGGPRPT